MHHDFIFKSQDNPQHVTMYDYIGLGEYKNMNSIRFLTWIIWGTVFDVNEEGSIRKEQNKAEKKKNYT